LFVCSLPGRECSPTHGGHPARDRFRSLKKSRHSFKPLLGRTPAQSRPRTIHSPPSRPVTIPLLARRGTWRGIFPSRLSYATSRRRGGGTGTVATPSHRRPLPPSLLPSRSPPSLPPAGDISLPLPTASPLPMASVDLREGRTAARQVCTAMPTRSSSLKRPSPSIAVVSPVSQPSTHFSSFLPYLLGFLNL
jgi:hypothetical protein